MSVNNKSSYKKHNRRRRMQILLLVILIAAAVAAGVSFLLYMESRDTAALRIILYLLIFAVFAAADVDASLGQRRRARNARLSGIDDMSGRDFEYWCAQYLGQRGFEDVVVTRASNDYGVDIVARLGERRYAVQCKRCSYPVGNKAVQEVYTGKKMYDCTEAAVITNSSFTEAAVKTADKVEVELWDRQWLEDNALNIK